MTKYVNPWHNPKEPHYGPAEYETEVSPKHHRGFDIYHRTMSVFDVVKDGTCVGQYAGLGGAHRDIDAYLDGTGIHYLRIPGNDAENEMDVPDNVPPFR